MSSSNQTVTKATKKSTKSSKPAATAASTSSPSTTASAPASTTPVVAPLTATVVSRCVSLLSQVDGLIGPVTALSGQQIRQTSKLRKAGLQTITDIVNLCNQHGVTGVGQVSVATMSAQLDKAKALGQIGAQLATLQKHFSDAQFTAQSATWQNATALYTVLQRLALMDPTIATGLAPVQSFFQTVRTKGKVRAIEKARAVKAAVKTVAANAPATTPSAAPAAAVNAPATPPSAAPAAAPAATSSAPSAATEAPVAPTVATPAPAITVTNGATHS